MERAELQTPVTGEELTSLLMFVILETVAAVSKTTKEADENLEKLAGHMLTLSSQMPDPRLKALLAATAEKLIETEEGAA